MAAVLGNPSPSAVFPTMYQPIPFHQRLMAAFAAVTLLASAGARAEITPEASALAKSVAAKIGSASTIRVSAKHQIDPQLGVGAKLEKGPLQITLQRPSNVYVLQSAGDETRELVYDGKTFCLMQPKLKLHALETLKATSLEQFSNAMDERFGFRPPVMELLSTHLVEQLFDGVTKAEVTGKEFVGWTRCHRLHIEQEGLTGDLWIGVKDQLPHRYMLTFTGVKGQPTWDIRLSKWELGVPVDGSLFTKRPEADSQKAPLLKSR